QIRLMAVSLAQPILGAVCLDDFKSPPLQKQGEKLHRRLFVIDDQDFFRHASTLSYYRSFKLFLAPVFQISNRLYHAVCYNAIPPLNIAETAHTIAYMLRFKGSNLPVGKRQGC